jgi:hypothetical protein
MCSTEPAFVLVLESAERDGEEPWHARRDTLIDLAVHAIKNLSKTGARFEDVLVSALITMSAGVLHFACH